MTRTSYVWQEAWRENVAEPHDRYGRPTRPDEKHEAGAAGSMFTTSEDYARFLVAILGAKGRRRATVDEMLRRQVDIRHQNMFGPGAWQASDRYRPMSLAWGLGWGRFLTDRGRAFFHTGHGFGWQNYTVTFADAGIGVVFLCNSDNFESVARELAEATIGDTVSPFDWLGYPRFDPDADREPPPEPVAVDVDAAVLKTYTGKYELPSITRTFTVKFDDGRLFVSEDDTRWIPLLPESETRFFVKGKEYRIVFLKNENGNVIGLRVELQGIEIPGEKVD